jgi:GntR family transcriptional regulator
MIRTDKTSPIPVYKQIVLNIKKDIFLGKIKEGDQLMTVRALAEKLKVNVNTVLKAYNILSSQGIIESKQGMGNFVKKSPSVVCDITEDIKNLVLKAKKCSLSRDLVMIIIQEVWDELNTNN